MAPASRLGGHGGAVFAYQGGPTPLESSPDQAHRQLAHIMLPLLAEEAEKIFGSGISRRSRCSLECFSFRDRGKYAVRTRQARCRLPCRAREIIRLCRASRYGRFSKSSKWDRIR